MYISNIKLTVNLQKETQMNAVEIKKDIYWVGVKDWNLVEFHGYSTPHGSWP